MSKKDITRPFLKLTHQGALIALQAAGVPLPAAIAVWYSPLVLAMVYDLQLRGRVHAVYWIGAAAMAFALLRLPF